MNTDPITAQIIVNYLHYISFMMLFAALVMEHLLIKPSMPRLELRRLAAIDAIYGISAIVVLVTGLLKVMKYGKGPEYYMNTWVFHAKLTLFIVAVALSILPTIKILKAHKTAAQDNAGSDVTLPGFLKHVIRLELLFIALLPLLGAMMALGVGINE